MTLFFSIGAFTLLPIFVIPLMGLLSGVKPHLELLALVIPYPGNPKL